jgi:hypothetical protein
LASSTKRSLSPVCSISRHSLSRVGPFPSSRSSGLLVM